LSRPKKNGLAARQTHRVCAGPHRRAAFPTAARCLGGLSPADILKIQCLGKLVYEIKPGYRIFRISALAKKDGGKMPPRPSVRITPLVERKNFNPAAIAPAMSM
jgi:hypothetical protein